MLCVQLVGDSTVLTEKVAHCHLKRLKLWGYRLQVTGASRKILELRGPILPILSGAKDNLSITDLQVAGEPITTCLHVTILYHVRALKGLYMYGLGHL